MITIVDYGMGNLRSVAKAFEAIGCGVCVSGRSEDLERAERIVLPGDGAFATGMENLHRLGLIEPLRRHVIHGSKPFLGICLGMQLLARRSWEQGEWVGLGWIDAEVRPLDVQAYGLRVPHMGWDDVTAVAESVLLPDQCQRAFYFVHGYHVICTDQAVVKASCTYGVPIAAVVEVRNIFATQFHPEKSQRAGMQLLRNFVNHRITDRAEDAYHPHAAAEKLGAR
jgi:glutamine amidotransferase